jgi:hypothetical protein
MRCAMPSTSCPASSRRCVLWGCHPGSMPLVSAVTWAFVPQRLASSAGIRQPRTACRGPGQADEPRRRPFHGCPAPSVAVHLPRWTACVRPQVSLRNTGSPGGEPSTRQSVQSAVRAPGVGDEGGPSSPTTLPVSPASLGGSQGHAPDLLKKRQWCWSRYGVEPSDRCDRRWPCSPAAARTQRGPSSRSLRNFTSQSPCLGSCRRRRPHASEQGMRGRARHTA